MTTKIALVILAVMQLLASHAATCAESPKEKEALFQAALSKPVQNYNLSADNFVSALVRIADEFKIPMGIQWVDASTANTKIELSWKDTTPREILIGIVNTQPNYELKIQNGIVHVYCKLIPSEQNFLLLKVPTFEIHNEIIQIAALKLRAIARDTVVPPKAGSGTGGNVFANTSEPQITLRLNNTDVEGVLDALASISDRKIWVVTFADSYILTATGFRRTSSLWNASIPENEQPVWDLFRWSEPLPTSKVE